jgi:HD-GYP domain-containing protein (c-di-GMP phosphodiesterase class II)
MANQKKSLDDFFKKADQDPDELKSYVDEMGKGVDPNKTTRLDKIAMFFKHTVDRIKIGSKTDSKKPGKKKKSGHFSRRIKIVFKRLFNKASKRFNFESGVDILDETSVLYRRNRVIKNILIITNIVFLIFTLIGNKNPNYIVIFGFGIIMFATNTTLKRIIKEEPRTLIKQKMAMYIASVYILLASFGVYIKLRVGVESDVLAGFSITQAGYVLIYFALVVIALYQDATLLRILFKWILVLMTVIHVTIMYPLYEYATSIEALYQYLVIDNPSIAIDIVLRTLVLIIFNIALYSSVAIGEMMNNKRKEELIKRRDMESDFKAVVGDVFDVIGVFNVHSDSQDKTAAHRVAEIASRLGNVLGLSPSICSEIYDYSKIHVDRVKDLSIIEYEDKDVLNEEDYQVIREKTILGSVIIKRLQLNQKSEDIVRAHFEKTADRSFTEKMKRIQRSQEGQIILLGEIYEILRQSRNYKTALNHKRAIELLELEFKEYFEPYILDRFIKYGSEFENYYERFKTRTA